MPVPDLELDLHVQQIGQPSLGTRTVERCDLLDERFIYVIRHRGSRIHPDRVHRGQHRLFVARDQGKSTKKAPKAVENIKPCYWKLKAKKAAKT